MRSIADSKQDFHQNERTPDIWALYGAAHLESLPYDKVESQALILAGNHPEYIPRILVSISKKLRGNDLIAATHKIKQLLPTDETSQTIPFVASDEPVKAEVKIDPGLWVDLRHVRKNATRLIQVYSVLISTVSQYQSGKNYGMEADILAMLLSHGVDLSERQISRILAAGDGLLWTRHNGRVFWHGKIRVNETLARMLSEAGKQAIAEDCRPHKHETWVSFSGDLEPDSAMLYGVWLDSRNKDQTVHMSRATLSRIFNCTPKQLRNWENKYLDIEITPFYEQYAGPDLNQIPDHATPYAAVTGGNVEYRATWQSSNIYRLKTVLRQHNHQGQGRKARKARNAVLRAYAMDRTPPDFETGAHESIQKLRFRGETAHDAFKALLKDIQRNDSRKPRTAFLGFKANRKGQRIAIGERFDMRSARQLTDLNERCFPLERSAAFRNHKQWFDGHMATRRETVS